MPANFKNSVVRYCLFIAVFSQAFVLSSGVLPSADAAAPCLRIALPEIHIDDQKIKLYQQAMEAAGLCVQPQALPQIRAVLDLREGKIDGVLVARDDLPDLVGVPVIHGEVLLGTLNGLLVVREGPVNGMIDLKNEVLGVPLGATWPEKLIRAYGNVLKVPRGANMLQEMLLEGRIDAMLLDEYSLNQSGGVPEGYQAIVVDQFELHSWLRAEFADFLPKFDAGTAVYLGKLGY
ncbi:MAG: hypothetical protein RIB30_14885 [Thalassospira sp.]|uniref:hypothetical protein n=1 Tax=Thalassospira sp. TaxID=1912094 RepID=UPI0032EE19B1